MAQSSQDSVAERLENSIFKGVHDVMFKSVLLILGMGLCACASGMKAAPHEGGMDTVTGVFSTKGKRGRV